MAHIMTKHSFAGLALVLFAGCGSGASAPFDPRLEEAVLRGVKTDQQLPTKKWTFLYYGAGDKHIAAARTNLRDFLRKLTNGEHATLDSVI